MLETEKSFSEKLVQCGIWMAVLVIVVPSMLTRFIHLNRWVSELPLLIGLFIPFLVFRKNCSKEGKLLQPVTPVTETVFEADFSEMEQLSDSVVAPQTYSRLIKKIEQAS